MVAPLESLVTLSGCRSAEQELSSQIEALRSTKDNLVEETKRMMTQLDENQILFKKLQEDHHIQVVQAHEQIDELSQQDISKKLTDLQEVSMMSKSEISKAIAELNTQILCLGKELSETQCDLDEYDKAIREIEPLKSELAEMLVRREKKEETLRALREDVAKQEAAAKAQQEADHALREELNTKAKKSENRASALNKECRSLETTLESCKADNEKLRVELKNCPAPIDGSTVKQRKHMSGWYDKEIIKMNRDLEFNERELRTARDKHRTEVAAVKDLEKEMMERKAVYDEEKDELREQLAAREVVLEKNRSDAARWAAELKEVSATQSQLLDRLKTTERKAETVKKCIAEQNLRTQQLSNKRKQAETKRAEAAARYSEVTTAVEKLAEELDDLKEKEKFYDNRMQELVQSWKAMTGHLGKIFVVLVAVSFLFAMKISIAVK